jgi:hypothetical protein
MNHSTILAGSLAPLLLALAIGSVAGCSADTSSSNSAGSTQPPLPSSEATCDKFLAACNTAGSGATYTCDPKGMSARSDADQFKLCVQKAEPTCDAILRCTAGSPSAAGSAQPPLPSSEATCDKFLAACNTAGSGATYTCDPKGLSARSDADQFKLCVQKAEPTCAAILLCSTSTSNSAGSTQPPLPSSQATCDTFLAACNTADAGATYTCDPNAISARSDADQVKQCVQKAEPTCDAILPCFASAP